jgi:hypothetical protein
MKDKGLMKKFGAASPNALVKKLFLAGEISDISQEISKVNGYTSQDETDEVVKN